MTIERCPNCWHDLVDETELCSTCMELCESYCDCVVTSQCEECAQDEFERSLARGNKGRDAG